MSEDESAGACVTDELGSSSGSNDGCDKDQKAISTDGMGSTEGGCVQVPAGEDGIHDGEKQNCKEDHVATTQKELKKPDKPVPCPRCDSLDTKFCYYNNYNVSQPRHFCKNCQRYWTAGGTLRNVPVGAGRRKSKNPAAHQRNMVVDNLRARGDPPDNAQQLISCSGSLSPVGLNRQLKIGASSSSRMHLFPMDVTALDSPSSSTILNFGQESPISERMGAVPSNLSGSEVLQVQGRRSVTESSALQVQGRKSVTESSAVTDMHMDMDMKQHNTREEAIAAYSEQKLACKSTQCVQSESKIELTTPTELPSNLDTSLGWVSASPFSFVGGPCWQYGSGMGWNHAPSQPVSNSSSNSTSVNPSPQQLLTLNPPPPHPLWCGAPPAGLWTGLPWPLMQGAVWGWGAPWMMPWAPPAVVAAAATSPVTGKRSLEQGESFEAEKKGSLWVPKTLRIDDPDEAARSSIWTTLGLHNRPESMSSGGIFSAFHTKEVNESPLQARHSNPAAMTRSMAFQESNLG